MLVGPMLLAAVPAGTPAPELPALPRATADAATVAAMLGRDEAEASRGVAREAAAPSVAAEPTTEPPAPEPPVAEPVVAEPAVVEPVVAPEPPPPPPLPAVTGQLWVTRDVNVRSGPTVDTERIGSLAARATVDVTGASAEGWTQVVVDGQAGWVNGRYLSESEPQPEAQAPVEAAAAPAAAAPAAVSDAPCSISSGIESNLRENARAVYRAVCASFGGSVSAFGGLRPGDDGDHGSGRAVDIMVSGEAGWEIARFLQARTGELGITYLIYQQQYWPAGSSAGAWKYMEDRGSTTANHYDHVHVSTR